MRGVIDMGFDEYIGDNQKKIKKVKQESKNMFYGALIGLAVGDALGAPVEFKKRDTFKEIKDMRGGGRHNLEPGYWTDDTSMALCLAESLIESGFDLNAQLDKYSKWYQEGYLSSTGNCFDVGSNTGKSLEDYIENGKLPPERERAAGNGSLMRLAPVPMYFCNDFKKAVKYSGKSSLATHNNIMAFDACRFFGGLVQQFINLKIKVEPYKREVINMTRKDLELNENIGRAINAALNKSKSDIISDGFVIHSLEASLWSFLNNNSFEEAVLEAVNLGEDADTVGAITGQLAGSYYGLKNIPERWSDKLAKKEKIFEIIENLYKEVWN